MTIEGARFVPFSFEAGQEFSEHTATVPVPLQVFDGQVALSAAGRRWSSPAMGRCSEQECGDSDERHH